jgi:release factor glutamine methyltransferase
VRLRRIVKPILDRLMPPVWRWYVRKPRISRYGDVKVTVPPGVFHPGLFLSTRFLLQHLAQYGVAGRTLLELGAGSGMIAIVAARRGAVVTALDISSTAVEAIRKNAAANQANVTVVQSDLFGNLPQAAFDFILINPPYYPNDPSTDAEYAWFCGGQFEYFQRLFQALGTYCTADSQVLMVLSEDCKLDVIRNIAMQYTWQMQEIARRSRWGEWNFIYRIMPA